MHRCWKRFDSSLPRQQTLFNGSSLNQLVDHHFLRFRTTTQVIREFLRRSLANRKEIVRQFGSLDPSAALEKGRGVYIVEPEMSWKGVERKQTSEDPKRKAYD